MDGLKIFTLIMSRLKSPYNLILLSFLILPSLIYYLTSYNPFSLDIFLLMLIALLFLLMALNPTMGLVLALFSPLEKTHLFMVIEEKQTFLDFTSEQQRAREFCESKNYQG